jgi:glycosyltransferase involved in cell wall biosynthesis
MTTRWAILTGEYPPQFGGVSDYTQQVAGGLRAAGDAVTVYAPKCAGANRENREGVTVRRLPDHFGPRGLLALDSALSCRPGPDRILIQYVPHAFGWKALNLPFAAWVATRARRVAPVWVMFHEIAFPFRWRALTNLVLGTAHAVMARLVAGAAERVFVSVPGWERLLRRMCPRVKPVEWLPIPSNVPVAGAVLCPFPGARGPVIGHFGTYGAAVVPLLEPALVGLLGASADRVGVLLGRGGPAFVEHLIARHPILTGRLAAPGELTPEALAERLQGCDLLVQPFIDGISTRRTSAMAGLANGVPVVSNLGAGSEPLWAGATCVNLARTPDANAVAAAAEEVLALPAERRAEMGRAAATLYRDRFGLEHTIGLLRAPRAPVRR